MSERRAPGPRDLDLVFEALAHEARRHLIAMLGHRGDELSSGYLATQFQHSWPTTTRHLKVLEEAGVVHVRREGRGSYYRLDRDRLQEVVGGWLARVAPVDRSLTWTPTGPRTTADLAAGASDLARQRRKLKGHTR